LGSLVEQEIEADPPQSSLAHVALVHTSISGHKDQCTLFTPDFFQGTLDCVSR